MYSVMYVATIALCKLSNFDLPIRGLMREGNGNEYMHRMATY
jgi:hypothetical protein